MMDSKDLFEMIKVAAVRAVNASQPVNVCFGKVTSASPLKILVEQKMTLGEVQLVLTRNVTDFKTKVTIDWTTGTKSGGSGDSSFASHSHSVSGKKDITIHNGLAVGEEVVLMKQKGGQKYLVLDRMK